jgi:hypothetical protein
MQTDYIIMIIINIPQAPRPRQWTGGGRRAGGGA